MKYGLLVTNRFNLGDDIQSLAARQFLPSVDLLLDRENLGRYAAEGEIRSIFNGWFLYNTHRWPPPANIKPLLISFHIDPRKSRRRNAHDRTSAIRDRCDISAVRYRDFYHQHAPIGCRDWSTKELLDTLNVETYFSGCLTLTLPPKEPRLRKGILFVDPFSRFPGWNFRRSYWSKIPAVVRRNAIKLTHATAPVSIAQRFKKAEALLALYQSAELVVTSRLHCALPCAAFGTPVVYIHTGNRAGRLVGYEKLFPSIQLEELQGKDPFERLKELAQCGTVPTSLITDLSERCKEFIGR